MGRTPDHVAGFIAGYAAKPGLFAAAGASFADNLQRIYQRLRDNHLYVTYAIVPPQIDRSKPAHQQKDPALYAGVVKERDDGIVISGAQQLATAGVFSDYLHLTCIHPLRPGDEAYANGVVIPIDTPGLKLYAAQLRRRRHEFVRLSSHQPVRRGRLLLRVRQRAGAVEQRLHLPQPADLLGPMVEDASPSLSRARPRGTAPRAAGNGRSRKTASPPR